MRNASSCSRSFSSSFILHVVGNFDNHVTHCVLGGRAVKFSCELRTCIQPGYKRMEMTWVLVTSGTYTEHFGKYRFVRGMDTGLL